MKIKMLQSIAGHAEPRYRLADFGFPPGAVIEVDDELARAWIKGDIAIAAKKTDELTMPVEAYTLRPDSPILAAYREARAKATAQAEAGRQAAEEGAK